MKQYEMAWQVACGVVLAKWVLNPMIESWVEEWKKLPATGANRD